ncbi:MAG: hypothetical protein DMG95_13615 [Acidobacteria bacterium]|nr:MAG: hypothetical protein DMG95_13615 [Acidobacteriota bacterium]
MATQGSVLAVDIAAFSARLLDHRELFPRARTIVETVTDVLPGTAASLYLLISENENQFWASQATTGDVTMHESVVAADRGTLGVLAAKAEPLVFSQRELVREQYAHLNVRRTLNSLAYVPLLKHGDLFGAIEILSFDGPILESSLAALQPVAEVAASALADSVSYEQERNNALSSITRITQLYDLEKVFSSTLELDQLLPIIGTKFREVLECQAVNVWLLQPDESLLLMHQAGTDPTILERATQKAGDGLAGDVSDSGEPLLIESPDDERLALRNFALTSLTETAVGALHNASLLMAERKVEILEALVKTSGEITSTLDMDRVLQAIVNGPATVVPYERAGIALDERGGIQLKAVSGTTELNADEPQYRGMRDILRWGAILKEPLLVAQHGDEIDTDREETRAKFREYFTETGMRAYYIIPLANEEGRVGILGFESSDPDFLAEAHLEMIQVLASQATVALRNASLYKEVPLIGVLQPLFDRKKKFLALDKHRRVAWVVGAAAAVLFLLVFPLPLRVTGDTVVAPAHMAHLGTEFEGVISSVYVREGDVLKKGAAIASLEDWEYRSALAAAKAKYESATAQMDRALANNDGSEAGIQHAQADYWQAEVNRAQERLNRTVIRSPIDGVVATPQIENFVGHKLKDGESFVDIVDNSQALVDVAIDGSDAGLLHSGQKADLKFESFPERTYRGQVIVVSPQGVFKDTEPVFFARVGVTNSDAALRAGMQGRGKIVTGSRSAGVVMFRRPAMWIWAKLWSWFGW